MNNKNAYLRLRIIDKCINSSKDFRRAILDELSIEIGIDQINKDINTLRYEF